MQKRAKRRRDARKILVREDLEKRRGEVRFMVINGICCNNGHAHPKPKEHEI